MDRLTKKELGDTDGERFVLCNHREEDCNDSCQYGTCEWNRKALLRLKKYEDMHEKVEKRIAEIKANENYPHNFMGQMVEDFEWVLGLLN